MKITIPKIIGKVEDMKVYPIAWQGCLEENFSYIVN